MKKTLNVLLIEPKKCDREVLPILLKKCGVQSHVAECLKDAFFILENRFKIDAIILSNETIDKQHLSFAEWIKRKYPEIKILAISCRVSDKEECQARNILHLSKPITNCSIIADILKNNEA